MDLATFKNDWREVPWYGGKDSHYASYSKLPAPVGEDPPFSEPFGMAAGSGRW